MSYKGEVLMSVNNNIDWKLVAQGYDANHNGRVDDELKVNAPGLADKDGKVTVDALANALSNDSVVVSSGAINAQKPGSVPHLGVIDSLNSIHTISGEALGWGDPNYPGWQYQETKYRTKTGYQDVAHTHKNGTVYYKSEPYTYQESYVTYRWGSAIQDVRARLQAIQAVAGQSNDSSMRAIANIASNALNQNNWEYMLDEGTAHSRYVALYISLQNINQLSNTPNQPDASVNNMNGAVLGAKTALSALNANLNNQAVRGSDAVSKLQAAIQQQKDLANNTSGFWHPFKKHDAENRATQLQKELNTLQGVDPTGLNNQLTSVARRDYETTQEAWGVNNLDGANRLQNDVQPVANDANNLKNQASDQANQVQDLINQLQGTTKSN
jgi:hypothetical protein